MTTLLEGRIKFVCCDMPEADSAMLQIHSAIAEREAIKINEHTKSALAARYSAGQCRRALAAVVISIAGRM